MTDSTPSTLQASITITDAAKQHLMTLIAKDPTAKAFRISIKATGCSGFKYASSIVAAPEPTDEVLSFDNLMVCLDSTILPYIRGTTLDLVSRGLGQKQLEFHNPNVKSHCGCGKSFSVNS